MYENDAGGCFFKLILLKFCVCQGEWQPQIPQLVIIFKILRILGASHETPSYAHFTSIRKPKETNENCYPSNIFFTELFFSSK